MSEADLDFLYALKREGIKLDLDVMKELAGGMGNPQEKFKSFHVAGTNGKGSVACFIFNILSQRDRVGLYTSPHLVDFNERIMVGREFIPTSYIEDFIHKYRHLIEELEIARRNPTFFETTTLMAFLYFAENNCRYASVEVGLGGRLDSTNIVIPAVSTITGIGYDHTDKLGTSLSDIAYEKAGIIKPNVPVVLSDRKPEVVAIVRKIAARNNSRLVIPGSDYKVKDLELGIEGTRFTLNSPAEEYHIESEMIGDFQVNNIISAIASIEAASPEGIRVREIENGIKISRWPARLELVSRDPPVVLDCAHNPHAAGALVRNWKTISTEKPVLVTGMLKDKDIMGVMSKLSTLSEDVIFTTPDEPERASDPEYLQMITQGMFKKTKVIRDPVEAYLAARNMGKPVLIAGSMYLVGIIKKFEHADMKPFK